MHASEYWLDISTTTTLLLLNIVKAKLQCKANSRKRQDLALEQ